jgi:hypothetical protein
VSKIQFASRVQVFGVNGRHLRCIHREEAERQYRHQRFSLDSKNDKGEVKTVIVSSPIVEGSEDRKRRPLTLSDLTGTRYSYREHLESGRIVHDLRRLGGARGGKNYAPAHLSPIFLQVCIDAGLAVKPAGDPTCGAANCPIAP